MAILQSSEIIQFVYIRPLQVNIVFTLLNNNCQGWRHGQGCMCNKYLQFISTCNLFINTKYKLVGEASARVFRVRYGGGPEGAVPHQVEAVATPPVTHRLRAPGRLILMVEAIHYVLQLEIPLISF